VSGEGAKAELIADRGEAAVSEEFFRSREFLSAEGVTHSLRIEAGNDALLAPLIVREIPGTDQIDAISPYGYPGIVKADFDFEGAIAPQKAKSAIVPADIDFSGTGLVSAFIRHTLDSPVFAGATERNVVQIADPALPLKSRGSDRNQINKNRRNGYEVRLVPGPETTPEDRAGLFAAYEQTMRRTGAAEHYFFGNEYFETILGSPRTWLVVAHAPEGGVVAASIATSSDGFLHYYLSGSADSHLRDSPMKNVVAALIEHATQLDQPLNLGGGMTRGDRLEEFKRGFANREQPWHTSELTCDPTEYDRLSSGHKATSFFPAYRT
jgi:Acetyltransferase (GNAT) domain